MLVQLAGIILSILGLIMLLWGDRLHRVLIPLVNFFIGFTAAAGVFSLIAGEDFMSTSTSLIAGAAAGVVISVLSFIFSTFAAAVLAGAVGYGLVVYLLMVLDIEYGAAVAFGGLLGAAVAAAIAVLNRSKKWLTIVLTSAVGAFAVVAGILTLFELINIEEIGSGEVLSVVLETPLLWPVIWLVIAVLGYFAQSRQTPESGSQF